MKEIDNIKKEIIYLFSSSLNRQGKKIITINITKELGNYLKKKFKLTSRFKENPTLIHHLNKGVELNTETQLNVNSYRKIISITVKISNKKNYP